MQMIESSLSADGFPSLHVWRNCHHSLMTSIKYKKIGGLVTGKPCAKYILQWASLAGCYGGTNVCWNTKLTKYLWLIPEKNWKFTNSSKMEIFQIFLGNKHTKLDPRYLSGRVKHTKMVKISQRKPCFK